MPTASRPASAVRRSSQVYVSVPPSSYSRPSTISRKDSMSSSDSPSFSSLKENTPLRPTRTNSELTSMTTLSTLSTKSNKRKHAEDTDLPLPEGIPEVKTSKAKKPRLSSNAVATKAARGATQAKGSAKSKAGSNRKHEQKDNSEEFPNGFFYCHQCTKKRDVSFALQCTIKDDSKAAKGQCRLKYCRACLKNRYQEDMDDILSGESTPLTKKEKAKHIANAGYYYECPRCRDECNCSSCRKAKGLEPTGNLSVLVRKAGVDSPADLLKDPQAISNAIQKSLPPKTKTEKKPKTSKAGSRSRKVEEVKSVPAPKPAPKAKSAPKIKAKPAPPPKPLPKLVWTRIPVALNREQVETRIHIREFILRFASALQIASTNVDELEELAGPSLGTLGEWEDQEDFELVGWVSEGCLKAMVLGLLDVIAGAVQASGTREQLQTLKEAIKSIRLGGPNLTRIWSTLRSLRDTLGQVGNLFAFELSDPLPPPTTMVFRSTRSGQQGAADIHISSSAQLVYVVFDLLEIALCSPAIRDAIEAGVTDEKDLGKEVKDALLRENAQWKAIKDVKKAKDDVKMNRERHKQMLQDVEYAHRIATRRCIPRFTSLGQDAEGRVYYILSPGAAERDSAQQLLVGNDVKVKYGRKRGPVTEEDRKELKRWSWFVLIWGRKPRGALVASDEDEDDEEDEEEECWWAFWNPTEIQKLAEWLIRKQGLDGTEPLPLAPKLAVSKAGSSRKRSSLVNSRALSPLSDLSSDEDEEDSMEEDELAERAPTHSELLTLVQGLKDFGELLQWRVQRLAGDETVEKAGQEPAKPSTIPASRFYG